jgi:hypothetical protein
LCARDVLAAKYIFVMCWQQKYICDVLAATFLFVMCWQQHFYL